MDRLAAGFQDLGNWHFVDGDDMKKSAIFLRGIRVRYHGHIFPDWRKKTLKDLFV